MPSKSRATTSRLTSPGTMAQISSTSGRKGRFSFAISDGLVVTPSTTPMATPSLISETFAVSRKIFMGSSSPLSDALERHSRAGSHRLEHRRRADHAPHDVDGAGGSDLVGPARGGRAEEDAEGLARRPVAEVAQLDHLARRVLGGPDVDREVDLVAPSLGPWPRWAARSRSRVRWRSR